jgi:hypothetical protein
VPVVAEEDTASMLIQRRPVVSLAIGFKVIPENGENEQRDRLKDIGHQGCPEAHHQEDIPFLNGVLRNQRRHHEKKGKKDPPDKRYHQCRENQQPVWLISNDLPQHDSEYKIRDKDAICVRQIVEDKVCSCSVYEPEEEKAETPKNEGEEK